MTELDKRIFVYCLWIGMCFLFFAEKPEDAGKFFGKLILWWLSPIILVLMFIIGFFERKKFRWFKRRWALIVLNQWMKWMIYGMVEKYQKYF